MISSDTKHMAFLHAGIYYLLGGIIRI